MSKTITGNQLLDLIAEGMKDETDLVQPIAIGDELKKIIYSSASASPRTVSFRSPLKPPRGTATN